ncbi:MAG: exodeoxyribonuclease V subunit alpha [Spirochaetes bacterium]|nr:exodeoxyribonuclease V subunit alpha [Spirochaetota bacterium]
MTDFRDKYSVFDIFDEFDFEFADNVVALNNIENEADKEKTTKEDIYLVSLIASHASKNNSVCFDLTHDSFDDESLNDLIKSIINKNTFAKISYDKKLPIVIDNSKIYLRRYYEYEKETASEILNRASAESENISDEIKSAAETLLSVLDINEEEKKVSVINALSKKITFISGGPGTGKTSLAVNIILLYIKKKLIKGERPSIALCAPTGKAAAHLKNSVESALVKIKENAKLKSLFEEEFKYVPLKGETVQKLIGTKIGSITTKFNNSEPLPNDLIIADETSMFDLSLMKKLFSALSPSSAVVFLGDKDQLASVQAGSVFGDICSFDRNKTDNVSIYSKSLRKSISVLKKSFRFDPNKGIGKISKAVNESNVEGAWEAFNSDKNIKFIEIDDDTFHGFRKKLRTIIESEIKSYSADFPYIFPVENATPEELLVRMKNIQILSALRNGPAGFGEINQIVEEIFGLSGNIYHGMPVMAVENDYDMKIFNGDTGIICKNERMYAYFPGDDSLRKINPYLLKSYEKSFCMTVHKSQGSEFENVIFVIPNEDSRVFSKELIYTALTRAKKNITIIGSKKIFNAGILRKTERSSGLSSRLCS